MVVLLKIRENVLWLESVWTLFVCQRLTFFCKASWFHSSIICVYVSYSAITELDWDLLVSRMVVMKQLCRHPHSFWVWHPHTCTLTDNRSNKYIFIHTIINSIFKKIIAKVIWNQKSIFSAYIACTDTHCVADLDFYAFIFWCSFI